jgi:sugar phosphate isomerase/epimerase
MCAEIKMNLFGLRAKIMWRIAISSWTLHRTLGKVWYDADGNGGVVNKNGTPSDALPLLELPALVAQLGIHVMEICHFHFPAIDDAYLAQLKAAIASASVELVNILIDTGNLSSSDETQWQADLDLNKRWMDIAAKVGAKGVRVDCGVEAPTQDALKRSAMALNELTKYGESIGVKVTTENWRTTSLEAINLLTIMEQVDRPLGLCVDFGNAAKTGKKYETLEALFPHGTSIHCKAEYVDGAIHTADLARCFDIARQSDFDGHVTIIYDGAGDERENIQMLKTQIETYIA